MAQKDEKIEIDQIATTALEFHGAAFQSFTNASPDKALIKSNRAF